MRIAYVTETYPPEINGVALTVARTVEHLRARHPLLLCRPAQGSERRGAAPGEWRSAGFPIPMYPELRFGVARPKTLAERFCRFRAELVHVATEGPLGWAAVVAARRLGVPVTSDFRTNFHGYSRHYRLGWLEPLVRGYLRRFHNRTSLTFAPTEETCRRLRADGFERVELIGRGVDLARFTPLRRDPALRALWGAAAGPVLLYVGRIAAEKNVELALRAYAEARKAIPTARMVLVGDGPRRATLAAAWPDVVFAGRQSGDALAACYASADLFVFPSLSETFGNVTLEALASGVPVVAFDSAAAGELVVAGVNGHLVSPGDETAFVRATVELAASGSLPALGAAARDTASAHGWGGVLDRFEARLLLHASEVPSPAGAAAEKRRGATSASGLRGAPVAADHGTSA